MSIAYFHSHKYHRCHYADAGVNKWLGRKCALYKQDTKNFSVDNVGCIFEDTTILWIILILHFSHTSLFFETITIKLGSQGAEG